nr:MAG TPA: hypothetical protein [Caudoviricetes sp.]
MRARRGASPSFSLPRIYTIMEASDKNGGI